MSVCGIKEGSNIPNSNKNIVSDILLASSFSWFQIFPHLIYLAFDKLWKQEMSNFKPSGGLCNPLAKVLALCNTRMLRSKAPNIPPIPCVPSSPPPTLQPPFQMTDCLHLISVTLHLAAVFLPGRVHFPLPFKLSSRWLWNPSKKLPHQLPFLLVNTSLTLEQIVIFKSSAWKNLPQKVFMEIKCAVVKASRIWSDIQYIINISIIIIALICAKPCSNLMSRFGNSV